MMESFVIIQRLRDFSVEVLFVLGTYAHVPLIFFPVLSYAWALLVDWKKGKRKDKIR